MSNPKIYDEIEKLLKLLQNWEDIDPVYMDEETKDIRHKISHIHTRTEISLEIILANHLLNTVDNNSVNNDQRLEFKRRFEKIIATTDFSKKLKSVQDTGLVPDELIGKIYRLNELRVKFSHQSAYQDEISNYGKNPEKHLATLKLLVEVYDGLDGFFAKTSGLNKKELKELEMKLAK